MSYNMSQPIFEVYKTKGESLSFSFTEWHLLDYTYYMWTIICGLKDILITLPKIEKGITHL